MRVAVVRRYAGCPAGVRALCLSLVMLGVIDSVALAPLALAAAVFPGVGTAMRAGLPVVAAAGVVAAALILALPRLAGSRRALRFRLALFLLLGMLGVGFSFPLALLVLCAGAARRSRSGRLARLRRSA